MKNLEKMDYLSTFGGENNNPVLNTIGGINNDTNDIFEFDDINDLNEMISRRTTQLVSKVNRRLDFMTGANKVIGLLVKEGREEGFKEAIEMLEDLQKYHNESKQKKWLVSVVCFIFFGVVAYVG